jgi:hypothetical protein
MMNAVEGYASSTSVAQGEIIGLHARSEAQHDDIRVRIFRVGRSEMLLHEGIAAASPCPTPHNAYEVGCGWPVAYSLAIPRDWSSGVYSAKLSVPISGAATEIPFVVRPAVPGRKSKILFQSAVNTAQAYNAWGGKSLYDYNSNGGASKKVSFHRPGLLTANSNFNDYERPFVRWVESHGIEVEYCTSIDLHANADLLNHYQLLLSVGHDEYWSKEMRDHVEAFVGNGGNAAFFSGDVCYWQVRFDDHNRTMVCYRSRKEDPQSGHDDSRVTVAWRHAPVNRPENSLTGVSSQNGARWVPPNDPARPAVPYVVRLGRHWVFDGTGLKDGEGFGAENLIVGYEADAAKFKWDENGIPRVTGEDGTPPNFLVLATADCNNWRTGASANNKAGWATMGIFRKRGTVFTAATTNWSHGLKDDWNAVSQITQNVLRRLSTAAG